MKNTLTNILAVVVVVVTAVQTYIGGLPASGGDINWLQLVIAAVVAVVAWATGKKHNLRKDSPTMLFDD